MDVNIEMENKSELEALYEAYFKVGKEGHIDLINRAMAYKIILLKNNDLAELQKVNHFITELQAYNSMISQAEILASQATMDQRMEFLTVLATVLGPAIFLTGFWGMNVQMPYTSNITLAYNPFFALCLLMLCTAGVLLVYLYQGITLRSIIISTIIIAIFATGIAIFLWFLDPIFSIGNQVGMDGPPGNVTS